MKKQIIVDIFIILILISFIASFITYCASLSIIIGYIKESPNLQSSLIRTCIYLIVYFISIVISIALFVLLNPRLFRRSTWENLSEEWEKNKQERIAARAAKADAKKQKRIEELEQKLDDLKKDE